MFIIGKEEAENETLAVRTYKSGYIGTLSLTDVISKVVEATEEKSEHASFWIHHHLFKINKTGIVFNVFITITIIIIIIYSLQYSVWFLFH